MMQLVLASSSPTRLLLLERMQIVPDLIISPDVDETPLKGENARELSRRLANIKLASVAESLTIKSVVIAADSVAEQGAKIMGKALTKEDVAARMRILSGKKHRLYSSVATGLVENGKIIKQCLKTSKSIISFKRLTEKEIEKYTSTGQGIGCEAGLTVEGYAGCFIKTIEGSYTGIMGLPLYETLNMLTSLGFTAK